MSHKRNSRTKITPPWLTRNVSHQHNGCLISNLLFNSLINQRPSSTTVPTFPSRFEMAPLGLYSLPTELRVLVLESVASPHDLLSLITTSKQYYNTFVRTPERILAQVLRNSFGVNLRHALGAFHASRLRAIYVVRRAEEREKAKEAVESLLSDYHHDCLELPTNRADLSQLSRLFFITQKFMTDYGVRSTQLLTGQRHVIPPLRSLSYTEVLQRHPLSLSATEETRLRRAFLRFDMYCQCFPLSSRLRFQLFFREDQARLFLSQLSGWEIEEMCCVHQYLIAIAEAAVLGVENDFVDEVVDAAAGYPQLWGKRRPKRCRSLTGPNGVKVSKVRRFDLLGLELFITKDHNWTRGERIAGIASHGLSFLADLLFGDKATRRTRFETSHCAGNFLDEAAKELVANSLGPIPGLDTQLEFDGTESWDRYNYGWSLLAATSWYVMTVPSRWRPRRPERDLGYVFWDAARLRDADIRDADIQRCLVFPKWERRSAQQRLKDVCLPFSLLKSIAKQYSSDKGYSSTMRY
ncbi:hypothetical protein GGR53DRAFT_487589 [Hypoxylon sp. FL1150]|nr:hypothetical protein GGR53DRAFT_487589 [Hypoxylon sp. FL1150]